MGVIHLKNISKWACWEPILLNLFLFRKPTFLKKAFSKILTKNICFDNIFRWFLVQFLFEFSITFTLTIIGAELEIKTANAQKAKV